MSLTIIDLRIQYNHKRTSDFILESKCIPELYWSFLKDYDTGKVNKCNIITSDDWADDLFKYTNWTDCKGINIPFDFESYFSSSNETKKKLQLEAVHSGMMRIAKEEGWDFNPLLDAYNKCIENELIYEFVVGKYKSSPNRKFKINFKCKWDIDKFEVYYLLVDKSGDLIVEKKVLEKPSNEGEFIYYAKWKWLDSEKILLEDKYVYGKKETWEIKLGHRPK